MQKVVSSNSSQVKPLTFKIDFCFVLLPNLALYINMIGLDQDWLAHDQDNETDWDIGLWRRWPGLTVRLNYKVAILVHCAQVGTHPDITLDVAGI